MKIVDKLKMPSRRYQRMICGLILLIYGCSERQTTQEVLLEFKQQPNEKYVYNVADSVEWDIEDVDKRRYTFQHIQEQKSDMVIEALDSATVRTLTMSFVVTKDTMLNAPEFVLKRRRRSIIGLEFGFILRMRNNGEVVKVVTDDPKAAFEFDRTYKPSQPVFPDHAISPGYTWMQNFSVEVPRGAPTVASTQYQLNSFTKVEQFDCAVVDFKGGLEYEECHQPSADKPKVDFLLKKYRSQVTSEGQIFFAYREGFMVKRINLITSTVRTTTYTKDKTEQLSQSVFKDREIIILTAIHRPGEDVISYRIP